MSGSPEPAGDAELARLLNALTLAAVDFEWTAPTADVIDARTALLDYLAARYVRRDRLVPDEWDDLDATAKPMSTTAVSAGEISALRQRYLRGDGVTLSELKQAEATHRGSYRAACGVLPRRPGDELPEDAIRRVRDGE